MMPFGFGTFPIDTLGKAGSTSFLICTSSLATLLDVWAFLSLKSKIGTMGSSDGSVFKYRNAVPDVCFPWVAEFKFFFRIVSGGRRAMSAQL